MMTKKKFLIQLEKKLQILEATERQDIILEYSNHIDQKIKEGKSENEAIKDFGDLDDLVREILKAYKISPDFTSNNDHSSTDNTVNKITNTISNILDKVVAFFKDLFNKTSDQTTGDILSFIIEVLAIIFMVWLLRIPFSLVKSLGFGFFSIFEGPIDHILKFIWGFVIEIGYFISAVVILVSAIKSRAQKHSLVNSDVSHEPLKKKKSVIIHR